MRSSLEIERDFNREIVDTVQALMVSISPCGMILSLNSKAEEVTEYSQEEVYRKYWVDVLMTSENNGFLKVSSEMGHSTSLIIDLPIAETNGGSELI